MAAQYTTKDGFTLHIHSAGYIDWAFSIEKDGETIFSNPCFLDNGSCGWNQPEDEETGEPLEEEGTEWTEEEWNEYFSWEADNLLESALGCDYFSTV